MCGSRRYPFLPPPPPPPPPNSPRAFWFATSTSPEIQFTSMLSFQTFSFATSPSPPHPLGISIDPLWGRYGYFLKLHSLLKTLYIVRNNQETLVFQGTMKIVKIPAHLAHGDSIHPLGAETCHTGTSEG